MIALSKLLNQEITLAFRPPLDELDEAFLDQLQFVFNQCVQSLRRTGWTRETLVRVGGLLVRLHTVSEAYKSRKQTYTVSEWIQKLSDVGGELDGILQTVPGGP